MRTMGGWGCCRIRKLIASRGKTTSFSNETQALVNQNIGAELPDVLLLVIFLQGVTA
jgi:hypothetical protein